MVRFDKDGITQRLKSMEKRMFTWIRAWDRYKYTKANKFLKNIFILFNDHFKYEIFSLNIIRNKNTRIVHNFCFSVIRNVTLYLSVY